MDGGLAACGVDCGPACGVTCGLACGLACGVAGVGALACPTEDTITTGGALFERSTIGAGVRGPLEQAAISNTGTQSAALAILRKRVAPMPSDGIRRPWCRQAVLVIRVAQIRCGSR
ncbi:MAG: hypothetical protein EBX59_09125 [Betaproteobacteria bacterium]|nr:hypothetical protein [Betaproteobacteria bacterium]NCZ47712.1 hypothetical protein [Betaproteobacteria bacterium]NCZ83335.1 hypothetical protein [Betaproteobacteria bacterium]